jgi:tetrahydromethanopterin S-methyltransferase subunit A
MVVEVSDDDGDGDEDSGAVEIEMSGELALIHSRMKVIQMMVTDMGYRNRYAAGVYSGKVEGVMIGLVIMFVLLGFLLMG